MRKIVPAALAFILLAACATAPSAAGLSIKDEMKQVVDPASTSLFAVQGDVDPANMPEKPATAARWKEGSTAAAKLVAVAKALQAKDRAINQGDWMKLAHDMETGAATAQKAADTKNGAAFADAVNALADNCFACHGKYKDQSGA